MTMDVIMHLGAHRTASTTFQHYMRDHARDLAEDGLGFWGPVRVRKSIFPGLFRNKFAQKSRSVVRRAEGRVRLATARAEEKGFHQLLISDENLLDTPARSYRHTRLYPAAGERLARINAAFDGQITRIVFVIRSQELWWSSSGAMMLVRGHPVPPPEQFEAIAASTRSWRDVITDMACAAPNADLEVIPFEHCAGQPDAIFELALQRQAPRDGSQRWLNRSADLGSLRKTLLSQGGDPSGLPDGNGRWKPFTEAQAAKLREDYADDLHWLTSGADGLARLTQDAHHLTADAELREGAGAEGQTYDKGHVA